MYACIDLGSNSFHLLIGEWQDGKILITERCSEKVQLGEGVLKNGAISPEAFQRGMECLVRFEKLMASHGVRRYWALGTNTFRVAHNAEEFIAAAAGIGLEISIVSGVQEAVLIYAGVISDLPPTDRSRFIIDIGGGSTELIVGAGNQRLITHSLPVGCVSWRDRYFNGQDTVARSDLETSLIDATEAARSLFQSVAPGVNHYEWSEAYASSGTAKMLAAVCHQNGYREGEIRLTALRQLMSRVVATIVSGDELAGLKEKRRDLLLPGYAIMVGLMEAVACECITFSATALREGMMDFIAQTGDTAYSLDPDRLPEISFPLS